MTDHLEPTPTRANHPPHCPTCNGTGWQPAAPIYETVHGETHHYPTLAPCTRDHWNDDPTPDPPLPGNHPTAMAALAQGYIDGQHELWIMSHHRQGAEDVSRRQDIA